MAKGDTVWFRYAEALARWVIGGDFTLARGRFAQEGGSCGVMVDLFFLSGASAVAITHQGG